MKSFTFDSIEVAELTGSSVTTVVNMPNAADVKIVEIDSNERHTNTRTKFDSGCLRLSRLSRRVKRLNSSGLLLKGCLPKRKEAFPPVSGCRYVAVGVFIPLLLRRSRAVQAEQFASTFALVSARGAATHMHTYASSDSDWSKRHNTSIHIRCK